MLKHDLYTSIGHFKKPSLSCIFLIYCEITRPIVDSFIVF